jgi:hypothetical protein
MKFGRGEPMCSPGKRRQETQIQSGEDGDRKHSAKRKARRAKGKARRAKGKAQRVKATRHNAYQGADGEGEPFPNSVGVAL